MGRKYYINFCSACKKEKFSRKDNIDKLCRSCSNKKKAIARYGIKKPCKIMKCYGLSVNNTNFCKYHKRKMFPEKDFEKKNKARGMVNYLILQNKLKKEKCFYCNNINSQAHHPNYNNPLYIIWLCQNHHRPLHNLH